MEKAVDTLEGMFSKAEKDLDYMSRKLDYQLENLKDVDQKANPVKLMKKLDNIKSEYASVVEDVRAIQEAQKEFTDMFRSQLLTLTDALHKLDTTTGKSSEWNDGETLVFDQLSSLLGIPPGQLKEQACGGGVDGGTTGDGNPPSSSSSSEIVDGASASSSKTSHKEQKEESLSAAEKRAKAKKFCEISEEEFQSVSQLIRQRLKREDVNKVYKCLWQHFKEEKNSAPLSPKDMNAMGLKITGASGEAKLKVLRSLKLCEISRTGSVTLT